MNIGRITDAMEEIAPKDGAMDFDNVGLLLGRRNGEVKRVITALDCTGAVVREAAEKGAEMIICHHPILFSGTKRITDETEEGRMLLDAAENGIAIFAAHTNLDFADGGLNDFFLEKAGYAADGAIEENEGRLFNAGGKSVSELCEGLKDVFGLSCIRTSMEGDRLLFRGALCTGGGKSLVPLLDGKADFYISGDLGHHDIYALRDMGIGFIELSHYDSEKIAMELLKKRLDEKLNGEAEVIMSEANTNPMNTIIF